jgi:hypothetical protein
MRDAVPAGKLIGALESSPRVQIRRFRTKQHEPSYFFLQKEQPKRYATGAVKLRLQRRYLMPEHDGKRRTGAEARRIIERIDRESASGGLVERTKGHFSAEDADPADHIEVWGTRIGRILGLLVLIAMIIWVISSMVGKT